MSADSAVMLQVASLQGAAQPAGPRHYGACSDI